MLTLIRNAKIYAPECLGVQDVLTADSRILKIGPDIPEVREYDVQTIDGTGMLLFPGFIDSHVHILGGGGEGSYHTRTPEIMLTDITTGGVTTVVGCLGTDGTTRNMAPLLAKARGLEEEGITTYIYTGSYQIPVRTLTGNLIDDLILIDKAIGCGEIAISDHRSSQPTKEEFARIVGDTRTGGILSGKAGVVNIHMGDGKRMLAYLRYVVEETEIPPSNMLPTHINRSMRLLKEGMDYAKTLGGFLDLTTSSDPDYLEEDEVKASAGLKMLLDEGGAGASDHIFIGRTGQYTDLRQKRRICRAGSGQGDFSVPGGPGRGPDRSGGADPGAENGHLKPGGSAETGAQGTHRRWKGRRPGACAGGYHGDRHGDGKGKSHGIQTEGSQKRDF